MKWLLLKSLLFSCLFSFSQNEFIETVVKDYSINLTDKEEVYLITKDFNNDSLPDILISGRIKGAWGNAGGMWDIYFQLDSGYTKCKDIVYMNHEASRYNQQTQCITSYTKYNCCSGSINNISILSCKSVIKQTNELKFESGDDINGVINLHFQGLEFLNVRYGLFYSEKGIQWNK